MGEISRQLVGKLKVMASIVLLPRSSKGLMPSPQTPDIEKLIAEGMNPVHAAYVFVHHVTSVIGGTSPNSRKCKRSRRRSGKPRTRTFLMAHQ